MSKEKITKTDIKWTIENCLRSAIERAAISKPLSVEMVDKAFEEVNWYIISILILPT